MTYWVRRLIVANVVMYAVTMAAPELYHALMFVPAWVVVRPWTVVTYMFLHGGFGHLFFNMLGLFFFGPRLEARLGSRAFLQLYFLSGIGGAVLSFFFSPAAAVVGASGAVYGILYGFARFWPTDEIYIWGVLPVQARVLVIGLAVLSLYFGGEQVLDRRYPAPLRGGARGRTHRTLVRHDPGARWSTSTNRAWRADENAAVHADGSAEDSRHHGREAPP